jgi:hypothetical protein
MTDYCDWQQSQVHDESLKIEFRKACDVLLAEDLDLEQAHEDQGSDFIVQKGMIRGFARRFVAEIEIGVKYFKCGPL